MITHPRKTLELNQNNFGLEEYMIRKKSVLNYDPYNPNNIEAERERSLCKPYTFVSTKNSKTRFCEHCGTRQPFLESEPHVKGWKCRKCR